MQDQVRCLTEVLLPVACTFDPAAKVSRCHCASSLRASWQAWPMLQWLRRGWVPAEHDGSPDVRGH